MHLPVFTCVLPILLLLGAFGVEGEHFDIVLPNEQSSRDLWKQMESMVTHFHLRCCKGGKHANSSRVPSWEAIVRDQKLLEELKKFTTASKEDSGDWQRSIHAAFAKIGAHLDNALKAEQMEENHDVKNLILFRFLFQFFQIFVAEIEQKVSEQFRQSPKAMKTMGMMKKQISEKIMAIREMAKMTAKGDKVDSAKGAREDHHVHNKHHKSPSEQLEHFEGNVLAQIKFNFVIHVPNTEAEGSKPICGRKSQKFAGDSVGSSSMNLKSLHNDLDVPITFTAKMWDDNPKTKEVKPNDWEWAPDDGYFPAQLSINDGEYVVNFSDDTNSVVRVMFCKELKCQELIWLDDVTASFYCYSLYVKKDGLGHYRVEIDTYNSWPLSNNFQFEFVVSGIYTPLSEHVDPLAPFERLLFGQQPSSSSSRLIGKSPQLPLPPPAAHVDHQTNTHFGDPFMGMRIIKVCNELEKTSILLTKDGQSLVTIGPKGVHHLPENHYMNSSEYRISVRHSTADHLNDVFAIRDFSDWRLKIESQRHANGVLEWKEAIWQDRAFRNVLFGDLSRGDYDLSIEMENGQIWFYIYHHNRLFADTKLFGITGFHNSIDP